MMQLKQHFIYIVTGFNLLFQKRYAWWIVCNDMYVSKII